MKIYLASFYSPDLKKSAQRFFKQASQMGIYDSIKVFSYQDLNDDFKLYVKDLLKKGKKKRIRILGLANVYSSIGSLEFKRGRYISLVRYRLSF